MRIFVTGGTGFVGSHAVRELAKHGHRLLLLSRGRAAVPKNCTLLRGDLSAIGRLEKQIKKFKPGAVLHLGWEGIPDHGPEMSIKNLLYGIDVLRLAISIGIKKIVVSGSRWEYGVSKGVVREDDGLHATSAFFGAKTALHYIGAELAKKNGVDFIWARLFSVYGPGQKPHSLIPHLLERVRANLPPDVRTPRATEDFIYVTDVARALALILEKHKPGQSNTYNIGSGRLSSVKDIVNEIYGKNVIRTSTTPGYYADISKIKKEIGWRPAISIKQGVRKTVMYSHKRS